MKGALFCFLGFAVLAACKNTTAADSPRGRVEILVTDRGYEPLEVRGAAGKPLTLVFKRTTEAACGEEVVLPFADIRRKLPLNEAVEIPVTLPAAGRLAFTCGMAMMRGTIVVQ